MKDFMQHAPGWRRIRQEVTFASDSFAAARALSSFLLALALLCGAVGTALGTHDKIDGFVTAWGGSGTGNGQFGNPFDTAVDSDGHIYVADNQNSRVQIFDRDGTYLTKFGTWGGGNGQCRFLFSVAIDSAGLIYVGDDLNQRVQKFTRSGVGASMIIAYHSQFPLPTYPRKMAFNSADDLYVAGYWSGNVYKYTKTGTLLGTYTGFSLPISVAVDSADNFYVADLRAPEVGRYGCDCIRKFSPAGVPIMMLGATGSGDGQFLRISHVFIDATDTVYATDQGNHRVQVWTTGGTFLGWYGKGTATSGWHAPGSGETGAMGSGTGEFGWPMSVLRDDDGCFYVSDDYDDTIQKLGSAPIAPQEIADLVFARVESLESTGVLNGGQANALRKKIEQSLAQLDKGKPRVAAQLLRAFINQVGDLVSEGVLSPAQGQALIDAASAMREQLL